MTKIPLEHLINSRSLTTVHANELQLVLTKENNYLFDLSYLSVLDVNGEQASEFLQGQLTCDLRSVSDIQMLQGAQCNLKGRILTLMDVINWQGIQCILPKDLIESTQKSLIRTALLSRVCINENRNLAIFGFYLQNIKDIIPDSIFLPSNAYAQAYGLNYCYYHLGHGFYIFVVKKEFIENFCAPYIQQDQLLGSLTWHSLMLINQHVDIYPESRGLFLPHRIGLHHTHYISFDKGCYKGQEIIARTHYRATLKHELKIYVIKTNEAIYSVQKLYKSTEGTEIGELIDYSQLNIHTYLIAVSLLKEPIHMALFDGHSKPVELIDTNKWFY